jgi:adenine specific DNA methylase Mod
MLHSLLQFTPEEVMQFQVTYIEFDFDGEDDLTPFDKDNITSQYIGDIWEADDEEDLVEEITAASGWCIKSIDYRHVLK